MEKQKWAYLIGLLNTTKEEIETQIELLDQGMFEGQFLQKTLLELIFFLQENGLWEESLEQDGPPITYKFR